MNGTVVRAVGGFFTVQSDRGTVECHARGVFRKRGTTLLVGDRVTFEPVSETDQGNYAGIVTAVAPRETELVRPPIANCDHAVLVFSVHSPDFHGNLLDRMLVSVALAGLTATIVLSKVDLMSVEEVNHIAKHYVTAGYRLIRTGRDETNDLTELRSALEGHISVFAGPSGAGKSSLANRLEPQLGLKMGQISEKLGRGKHTTRHVELFQLGENTFVADAPGFSQLHVDVDSHELWRYFPEFIALSSNCEYRGCLHIDEHHCGVKDAVAQNTASLMRYESYKVLYEELRKKEERKY